MSTVAGVEIPISPLVEAATDLVRAAESPLLFHHSMRVFLFGSLRGRARGLTVHPELLYVGALFHDLGLTERYRTQDQRFEIDGADVARGFLRDHDVPEQAAQRVWEGVALHTTPEIPWHMAPEVALVTAGVEVDVLGLGFDEVGDEARAEVVAAHPRPGFKDQIVSAFHDGLKHRPQTAFGNVKADVLARREPGYRRPDFVEVIEGSAWPE